MTQRYLARFTGRQLGAIGIFHPCVAIVLGPHPTEDASILQDVRTELYAAYEHIQALTVTAYNGSLFDAVKLLGIEYDSHESDLYLPATKQVQLLLRAHGITPGSKTCTVFRHIVHGTNWYDVPFMYSPWWEARQR